MTFPNAINISVSGIFYPTDHNEISLEFVTTNFRCYIARV